MPSITNVTLLRNTTNNLGTATSFDITAQFLGSVTPTNDGTTITYAGASISRTGLSPATTYHYWLSCTDQAGLSTVQYLGSITTASIAPNIASAVDFDGTNAHLRGTGTLSYDTKVGTISVWARFDQLGTFATLFSSYVIPTSDGMIELRKDASNAITLQGRPINSTSDTILFLTTNLTVVADRWYHIIASWNLATLTARIYVNDVAPPLSMNNRANSNIRWAEANYAVGARSAAGGTNKHAGCVAELYVAREFIDITQEANRRKFISSGGGPVSLGADGSLPTGNRPDVYLSGSVTNWNAGKNFGRAGDFTVFGTLTGCSTSPQLPVLVPDISSAVDFGSIDYLTNAGSNRYDSKTGTASVWLRIDSATTAVDGTIWMNSSAATGKFVFFELQGGNYIRVLAFNSNVQALNYRSNVVPVNTWIHVLVAWDNATSRAHVYVDDYDQLHSVTAQVDQALGWDEASYTVGARSGGGTQYRGCMAEFYLTREYIDITQEANRRKFISSGGEPVSLGADGSLPTGNRPDVYLSGSATNWNAGKNFGSASRFGVVGWVTDCNTKPSLYYFLPASGSYYFPFEPSLAERDEVSSQSISNMTDGNPSTFVAYTVKYVSEVSSIINSNYIRVNFTLRSPSTGQILQAPNIDMVRFTPRQGTVTYGGVTRDGFRLTSDSVIIDGTSFTKSWSDYSPAYFELYRPVSNPCLVEFSVAGGEVMNDAEWLSWAEITFMTRSNY